MKKIYNFVSYYAFNKKPFPVKFLKKDTLKLIENREIEFLKRTKPILEKYSIDYPSNEKINLTARCDRLKKREEDIKKAIERTKELKALELKGLLLEVEPPHDAELPQEIETKVIGQDSEFQF